MKPIVRFTILSFAALFLGGAAFAWFDVITHENRLINPELKVASGWSATGLLFLGMGLRGGRRRAPQGETDERPPPA